jgi:hypothetical protein
LLSGVAPATVLRTTGILISCAENLVLQERVAFMALALTTIHRHAIVCLNPCQRKDEGLFSGTSIAEQRSFI